MERAVQTPRDILDKRGIWPIKPAKAADEWFPKSDLLTRIENTDTFGP